jgi:hypothetical protein
MSAAVTRSHLYARYGENDNDVKCKTEEPLGYRTIIRKRQTLENTGKKNGRITEDQKDMT